MARMSKSKVVIKENYPTSPQEQYLSFMKKYFYTPDQIKAKFLK